MLSHILFWSDSPTPPPPSHAACNAGNRGVERLLLHNLSIVFYFQFVLLSERDPRPTPSSLIPLFVIPSVRWQVVKTRSDNSPLSLSFSLSHEHMLSDVV